MALSDATIEKFAIRVALGNNGGTWADHYTEPQKEHWRQYVRDLIKDIGRDLDDEVLDAMSTGIMMGGEMA